MSTTTKAERFFQTAIALEKGRTIHADFSSHSEANSFRVALYRTRTKLGYYSITISIKDNTVSATKEDDEMEFRITEKSGEETTGKIKMYSFDDVVIQDTKRLAEREIPLSTEEIQELETRRDEVFEAEKIKLISKEQEKGSTEMIIDFKIRRLRKELYGGVA